MKFFGDVQGWLYGGASAEMRGLAAGFDPLKLFAAMAIAAVFGMVHALMPGHGKTVIVSYYLGRPARFSAASLRAPFWCSRMWVLPSSSCSPGSS
jgi:hypothetical protein